MITLTRSYAARPVIAPPMAAMQPMASASAPLAAEPRPVGPVERFARTYVALDCHCGHHLCPGWALVHDSPEARLHFNRLFGKDAA